MAINPCGQSSARLFIGQLAQLWLAFFHNPAPQAHLFFKFRIVCGDAQAVRRFGDIKTVTLFKPHLRQQVFGKDSLRRITNLRQFEYVHDAILLLRMSYQVGLGLTSSYLFG